MCDSCDHLIDPYMEEVMEKVLEYGWMVQYVGAATPEDSFCYTAGLALRHRKPELWLATLGPQSAGLVLNATARVVIDSDLDVQPGQVIDAGLTFPIKVWGYVSAVDAEAFVATNLQSDAQVVQVLWPDTEGRYPDDPGYDQVESPQRLLARVA